MTTAIWIRESVPTGSTGPAVGPCHASMDSMPKRLNPGLSSRETSVLQGMADGLADKEIGLALGVSRFTVNKHVCNILRKMGAASRTEAAVRALRMGLIV